MPGTARLGVGAGELELDVAVELLEALLAGELGPGGPEQRGRSRSVVVLMAQSLRRGGRVQAARGRSRAQLAAGVVQGLVERAAGGASRSARTSIGTPLSASATSTSRWWAVSAVAIASRSAREQLGALDVARAGRPGVGEAGPASGSSGTSRPCQARRRSFTPGLEQGELVGPGREAAVAAEVVELGQHGDERVVGAWWARSSRSLPRRRGSAAAAGGDLEARGAQQQLVQAPDRLGVGARVARAKGRQPLARVGVGAQLGDGARADGEMRRYRARHADAVARWRLEAVAAMVGSGLHHLLRGAAAPALTPDPTRRRQERSFRARSMSRF